MAGIRLTHPTARNVRYTVADAAVPYPVPYVCTSPAMGGCGSTHIFKTHHLNIDETGSCIVSEGVFERIRPVLIRDGFVVANEVAKPPAIGIGIGSGPGAWGDIPIIKSPHGREPTH